MNAALFAMIVALAPDELTPREDNPNYAVAIAAWDEERWADAERAFAAAYELDPRPEYVFAQARARRLGGDCAGSVPIFERFLALDAPEAAREDARKNIAECGGPSRASVPPAASSGDDTSVSPTESAAVDEPVPTPPPRRVAADPLGHALLWPGVALIGAGTGLLVEAHVRRQRFADADEQRYRDEVGPAATRSRVGITVLSVGAALGIAGAVRFIVLGTRARSTRRGIALVVDHRGLGAAW